jgi:hypothetical protein
MYGCIIVIIIFLLGLYYVFNIHSESTTEGFEDQVRERNQTNRRNQRKQTNKRKREYKCPNILVQKGNTFYLFNTKVARVPGVNPIQFDSLEDYTKFLDWQRSQNIQCPVLYLRQGYNTQGEKMYSAHPSPTDLKAGRQNTILDPTTISSVQLMDASRNDKPYNNNMYPGFDPQDQYIGVKTPLDKMDHTKNGVSPNPMKPNWGGQDYTQGLIDDGYYEGQEVYMTESTME